MDETAMIQTLKDGEKAQWERDFENIEGKDAVPLWEIVLRIDRAMMIDDIQREHAQRIQDADRLFEDGLNRAEKWYHEEKAKRKKQWMKRQN